MNIVINAVKIVELGKEFVDPSQVEKILFIHTFLLVELIVLLFLIKLFPCSYCGLGNHFILIEPILGYLYYYEVLASFLQLETRSKVSFCISFKIYLKVSTEEFTVNSY